MNLFNGRLQKEPKEGLSAFELIQGVLGTLKDQDFPDVKVLFTVGGEDYAITAVLATAISHGKDSDSTYVLSLAGEKMNIYDL